MAGHSHSANIKHRKNAVDGKRAKIFSKLARNLISAVRQGGDDLDTNLKLKYAVEKAKAANMPKDNIERAIKKGAGDKTGDTYEELIYEGYAPGGVALLICCLTDNRNRTAPDVKYTLEHCGGNFGSTGSVAFMFNFRSIFVVEMGERDEDQMMEIGLEAGAEDVVVEGDVATIEGSPNDFLSIKAALEAAEVTMLSAETGYLPETTAEVTDKDVAKRIFKLIDTLEDNEDVQNVYANYEMSDELLEEQGS
ncbi:MAG: YebC/PmpR family DNA-binding transcriptional regulator [Planctomycetota bacterium]|nr:YebC/PmpR family DNA-binding transcriptional regulator [Planctomycetota bacterium]